MRKEAKENPEAFWREYSKMVTWFKDWDKLTEQSFWPEQNISWFLGGKTNACYNAVDRHVKDGGCAITWVSSDLKTETKVS